MIWTVPYLSMCYRINIPALPTPTHTHVPGWEGTLESDLIIPLSLFSTQQRRSTKGELWVFHLWISYFPSLILKSVSVKREYNEINSLSNRLLCWWSKNFMLYIRNGILILFHFVFLFEQFYHPLTSFLDRCLLMTGKKIKYMKIQKSTAYKQILKYSCEKGWVILMQLPYRLSVVY